MRSSGTAVAEPDLDACFVAKAVARELSGAGGRILAVEGMRQRL
jgi:hypothetical protein